MNTPSIRELPAIDVHGHLGAYRCDIEMHEAFMSGDADTVVRYANSANTGITVVSSLKALLPEGKGDAVAGNEEVLKEIEGKSGLRCWTVLDPRRPESFEQCASLLQHPLCAGIKIHPEMHQYPISLHGAAIFEFAAKFQASVLTHSGQERSLPEDFLPFADSFPEVPVILAHLGFGVDQLYGLQVRAIQRSRHGNLFCDTSSSKSITPRLIEWAVAEIGAEKILYGTDSPLYFPPMMRARIDHADLRDEEKRLILRDNALRLLGRLREVSDGSANAKTP